MLPHSVHALSNLEMGLQSFILTQLLFQDKESSLDLDASLIQEGVVDSVGILDLVSHISSTYGIEVRAEEVTPDNFDSIRKLAAFILRKQSLVEVESSSH